MSVTIALCLPRGRLRLSKVDVLFIDEEEMDEILLRRPVLKRLGLNIYQHSKRVQKSYNNIDISDFMSQDTEKIEDTAKAAVVPI